MARGKGGKRKGKAQEGADQQAPAAETPAAPAASDSPVAEAAPEAPAPAPEPEAPAVEAQPEPAQEPEKAKEPEAPKRTPQKLDRADPDDQEMTLDEAAGAMVDGFKESWLPAIRAKARSMGAGDKASRRVWRGIFIAWGGPNILR